MLYQDNSKYVLAKRFSLKYFLIFPLFLFSSSVSFFSFLITSATPCLWTLEFLKCTYTNVNNKYVKWNQTWKRVIREANWAGLSNIRHGSQNQLGKDSNGFGKSKWEVKSWSFSYIFIDFIAFPVDKDPPTLSN